MELRDRLLDELAYVTGEVPGGQVSAECTLKVLNVLTELGWTKILPPDPNRPYLPGVNQCPNCNVGGCQSCDGNGH
jgi:hypothetical protein